MNVLRCLGERLCSNLIAVFLVMFGLTACAAEKGYPEKPPMPSEPDSLKEITFTLNFNGDLIIKDSNGKPIGNACSSDPKAPDVCPIFQPGHKIQVKDIESLTIIKYHGSDCVQFIRGGKMYSYCN